MRLSMRMHNNSGESTILSSRVTSTHKNPYSEESYPYGGGYFDTIHLSSFTFHVHQFTTTS